MVTILETLFAIAVSAPPVGTTALEFVDAVTDLRLSLQDEGSQICVLKPAKLRSMQNCDGIDVVAAEPTIESDTVLMAFFRYADSSFALSITMLARPGEGPMTQRDAEKFMKGVQQGGAKSRGLSDATPFDLLVVNDLQAIRYVLEGDFGAGIDTILTFTVVGKDKIAMIAFLTDKQHVDRVTRTAASILQSLRWTPVGKPATWTKGESDSERLGRHLTRLIQSIAVLAAICVGAISLYRAARRRSSAKRVGAADPQVPPAN